MTPRAAALGLLVLLAPGRAAASDATPERDTASPTGGATAAHDDDHEQRHRRERQRSTELGLIGGGFAPEVLKDPAVSKKISGMSEEEYRAYKKVLKTANPTQPINRETAQFAADAVGGPANAVVQTPSAEDPGAGSAGGIGFGVQGALAGGAPSETKVDPGVLRSFPPGHEAYPRAQLALAVQDQARGDHRAALSGFETAIAGGEDGARALTFASLSALNAGDPYKAAQWSARALEQDPSGKLTEQAEAINKLALKRLPKEADPLAPPARRTGEPGAGGARPGESVPELERPLPPKAADPGLPPEAKSLLAETNRLVAQASKAYRTGDIKEAVKLAGEALAKDPDDVRALQVRAAAQAKAGHWEEARKDAERGLDLAPGYVPLLLLRAAAAVHAKDWKAVKADAEAVLSKERTNPTAWRFQGLAQAALGDRAAASASLGRAAQYGDPEAPRLLAAARSLPPGADVVDLVELLAGSAAERESASAAQAAPPAAPPSRRGRIGLVVGAAVLAGVVAGGLILLLGRRDGESA